MTVSAPTPDHGRSGIFQRAVDWVFGYDFFISYSHGDGQRYPRLLKERLEEAGFRVFLDQTEYTVGIDLRRETRRQVSKSRKIVILGRRRALQSKWVKREVDIALANGNTPIIIDFNGAVAEANASSALATMALERHWLRLNEAIADEDGEPTDRSVDELIRGFRHTRQETKRTRVFATAATVLGVSTILTAWQAVEADRARRQAENERDRAERNFAAARQAADGLVFDIAQGLREQEGLRAQSVHNILLRADKTFQSLLQSAGSDPRILRSRAVMLNEFAKTYLTAGDSTRAAEAARASLEIAGKLAVLAPADATARADTGSSHILLGEAARAGRDLAAALGHFEAALAAFSTAAEREPDKAQWQRNRSAAINSIAQVSYWSGDIDRARREFEQSADIDRALLRKDANDAIARRGLATALANTANVAQAQGDYAGAARLFEEAIGLMREMAAAAPGNTRLRMNIVVTLANKGDAHRSLGDHAAARRNYEEGLAAARALFAIDPGNVTWRREIAIALVRVGDIARDDGGVAEALRHYEESVAIRRTLAGQDKADRRRQRDLAVGLSKLGELALAAGEPERAAALHQESLDIRQRLSRLDTANREWQSDVAMEQIRLGDVTKQQRYFSAARQHYSNALTEYRRLSESAPKDLETRRLLSVALNRVGEAEQGLGDHRAARAAFDEAYTIRLELLRHRPLTGEWRRDLAVSLAKRAETAIALGDRIDARTMLEESLVIRRELAGASGASVIRSVDLAEGLMLLAELQPESSAARRELAGEALSLVQRLERASRLGRGQRDWRERLERMLR